MQQLRKWLQPGLYVKRWLLLLVVGITIISIGVAYLLVVIFVSLNQQAESPPLWFELLTLSFLPVWMRVVIPLGLGIAIVVWGVRGLNKSLFGPLFARRSFGEWADIVHTHNQLRQGIRVVAVGGGTGMPSILRAMKTETNNITAIVTMADDGGSSGRLRRDLGMLPPGDLRNNIVALARDEDLMAQLLNHRFDRGELDGHNFGNLFIAALSETMGGMDVAAQFAGRVLAIQGRVLPCSLEDINLVADIHNKETGQIERIKGESNITHYNGTIEHVYIEPTSARALPAVMHALVTADLIVLGPGSLYTSIIPNLLVHGVTETMNISNAITVYVCNIATQPGETDDYTVADHVLAIEKHAGMGLMDVIIANNHYPEKNKADNTVYVQPAPENHAIYQNYRVIYTDLTDDERPWRHSPKKLRKALLSLNPNSSNMDEMSKGEPLGNTLQSEMYF